MNTKPSATPNAPDRFPNWSGAFDFLITNPFNCLPTTPPINKMAIQLVAVQSAAVNGPEADKSDYPFQFRYQTEANLHYPPIR
jgi:hypothetical protein